MESPSKVLFLYSCVVGIKKRGPKSFRNGRSNLQLFCKSQYINIDAIDVWEHYIYTRTDTYNRSIRAYLCCQRLEKRLVADVEQTPADVSEYLPCVCVCYSPLCSYMYEYIYIYICTRVFHFVSVRNLLTTAAGTMHISADSVRMYIYRYIRNLKNVSGKNLRETLMYMYGVEQTPSLCAEFTFGLNFEAKMPHMYLHTSTCPQLYRNLYGAIPYIIMK